MMFPPQEFGACAVWERSSGCPGHVARLLLRKRHDTRGEAVRDLGHELRPSRASPVALCGILLHADYPTTLKAADKLMAFVNTCSGNEFRDITRESGALDRCFWLLFQIDSGDREALAEISRSGAALDAVQLAC